MTLDEQHIETARQFIDDVIDINRRQGMDETVPNRAGAVPDAQHLDQWLEDELVVIGPGLEELAPLDVLASSDPSRELSARHPKPLRQLSFASLRIQRLDSHGIRLVEDDLGLLVGIARVNAKSRL